MWEFRTPYRARIPNGQAQTEHKSLVTEHKSIRRYEKTPLRRFSPRSNHGQPKLGTGLAQVGTGAVFSLVKSGTLPAQADYVYWHRCCAKMCHLTIISLMAERGTTSVSNLALHQMAQDTPPYINMGCVPCLASVP